MKIHPHISRAALLYIGIFLAGVVAVYVMRFMYSRNAPAPSAYQQAREAKIREYSLQGEVISTSKDSFVMRTGWVDTVAGVTSYVSHDKQILNSAQTKVTRGTNNVTFVALKIGDKVTVNGPGNPYTISPSVAYSIAIQ